MSGHPFGRTSPGGRAVFHRKSGDDPSYRAARRLQAHPGTFLAPFSAHPVLERLGCDVQQSRGAGLHAAGLAQGALDVVGPQAGLEGTQVQVLVQGQVQEVRARGAGRGEEGREARPGWTCGSSSVPVWGAGVPAWLAGSPDQVTTGGDSKLFLIDPLKEVGAANPGGLGLIRQ